MDKIIAALREEYAGAPLGEDDVAADPIAQFRRWFDDAVRAEVPLANGMTLATVGPDGAPSARVVLLKLVDERGFVFFTNQDSRKGRDLEADPRAALTFWWQPLHRQVRVEGRTALVEAELSDRYFRSRPRASNLSAIASPQSRTGAGRAELERRVAQVEAACGEDELERPERWGGFRVVPEAVEFWQGREDRLHDRLQYRAERGGWALERLAP